MFFRKWQHLGNYSNCKKICEFLERSIFEKNEKNFGKNVAKTASGKDIFVKRTFWTVAVALLWAKRWFQVVSVSERGSDFGEIRSWIRGESFWHISDPMEGAVALRNWSTEEREGEAGVSWGRQTRRGFRREEGRKRRGSYFCCFIMLWSASCVHFHNFSCSLCLK